VAETGNRAREARERSAIKLALDPNYFRRLGRRGGNRTLQRKGKDYLRKISMKGGKANAAAHDSDHFRRLGKIGGKSLVDKVKGSARKR